MKQKPTSTAAAPHRREVAGNGNGGDEGEVYDSSRGIIRNLKSHDAPDVTPEWFTSKKPSSASHQSLSLIVESAARRLQQASKVSNERTPQLGKSKLRKIKGTKENR